MRSRTPGASRFAGGGAGDLSSGMRKIGHSLPVLALALLVFPGASRAVYFGSVGLLLVSHTDVRGLPPTATTLRFTGLAEDHTTVLFGPATRDAAPRTALVVPLGIKILKIEYLDGAALVGLFEGFVDVRPSSITAVSKPPWVTQPPCHTPPSDEEGLYGAIAGSTGAVVFVER